MSLDPIVPPPRGDDLDAALFERYCLDEATPQELIAIETWFQQHPDQQAWYEALRSRLRAGTFAGVSPAAHARGVEVIMRYARGNRSSDHGVAHASASQNDRHWSQQGIETAGHTISPSSRRFSIRGTLPQVVRAVFNGLVDRAVTALFSPKDTGLTAAEIERLRHLVEEAETDDK